MTPLRKHMHKCIDATEVYRLSREEAYRLAENCPLCIEFVGFVIKNKRARAFNTQRPGMRALVREATLTKLLDRFDLFKRGARNDIVQPRY